MTRGKQTARQFLGTLEFFNTIGGNRTFNTIMKFQHFFILPVKAMNGLLALLLTTFFLPTQANVSSASQRTILLLPSPVMAIDGENAEAIQSLLSFMEERHCSKAVGGVVVEVAGYAKENATDAEVSAARARSYKVRAYLTERLPKYALLYSSGTPMHPERRYNKWDQFAPRTALPGAVFVGVGCLGVS